METIDFSQTDLFESFSKTINKLKNENTWLKITLCVVIIGGLVFVLSRNNKSPDNGSASFGNENIKEG